MGLLQLLDARAVLLATLNRRDLRRRQRLFGFLGSLPCSLRCDRSPLGPKRGDARTLSVAPPDSGDFCCGLCLLEGFRGHSSLLLCDPPCRSSRSRPLRCAGRRLSRIPSRRKRW